VQSSDLGNPEAPVELTVRATTPSFARQEGRQLSVAVTTSSRLTPHVASLTRRTQDVRIVGFSNVDDTFVVKLAPGHRVVSLPPEASGDTPYGSYSVKVEAKPGEVMVKSRVSLKVTRVSPAQYPEFKRFCAEVDAALSPRLLVSP
jgi:hypothetical protein